MERQSEAAHRDGNHPNKVGRCLGLEMRGGRNGADNLGAPKRLEVSATGAPKKIQ